MTCWCFHKFNYENKEGLDDAQNRHLDLYYNQKMSANKFILISIWKTFAIKDRYRKKRLSTLQTLKLSPVHP